MFDTKEQRAQTPHREAELIRYYGGHTLAFFGLAPKNVHFLAPGGEGLVSYRLAGNVAVVLGDPVCAPQAFERVTRSFLDFCALHDWRVAFYQAYPEHLTTYRALNLRAFKMGEEAIIHPQTFTLHGSAIANVRTSCRHAEREGVIIHWYEGVPPAAVMQQLEHISSAWLEGKAGKHASEMGFSTGRLDELVDMAEQAEMVASISRLSTVFHQGAPRLVTAVATTSAGKVCAFVTFLPLYGFLSGEETMKEETVKGVGTNPSLQRHCVSTASPSAAMQGEGWGWTLDMMRRAPDAPPGVMELLLVRAIERFRLCGAHIVSLGMVAMADTGQEMTPGQRQLARFVTDRMRLLESRHTLFNFKQKFHPCWESRYVVINSTLALPKIALAVLRIRNYAGGKSRSLFLNALAGV